MPSSYDKVMPILSGKGGRTRTVPCVNFAETYTEALSVATGSNWPQVHRDPEQMAKLGLAAHGIAGLDNVGVPFDILVEAEALGVPVDFQGGRVVWPSAAGHPVADPADLDPPPDVSSAGRVRMVAKAIAAMAARVKGDVPINAVIVPPFTGASSFLVDPTRFYYWVGREPEKAKAVLDTILPLYVEAARLYTEAGADVLTLHEMGGSTESVSPAVFQTLVKPYLRKLVESVKVPVVLNICGRVDLIASDMLDTGAAGLAFDETTPVRWMREAVDRVKPGHPLIGNISPVKVIHSGPENLIKTQVGEAVRSGISMVSPGCDFWIRTPTKHIRYLVERTAEATAPE